MQISRIDYSEFKNAYGIYCSPTTPFGDRDGMYSTFCQILPGKNTIQHAHIEPEVFYIIRGLGLIKINNQKQKVKKGDLIYIPALSTHELKNLGNENLVFLSIYCEDHEIPLLSSSIIITSAPPTPNGPLHLGHISGPYLASDILTRYLRLRLKDVINHCGTDDHQNYMNEKAQALYMQPETFRQQMRSNIQAGFTHMHIQFNEFIEPKTDEIYRNNVIDFVNRVKELNIIEKEAVAFPYCMSCNKLLIDAAIIGYCPYCKEISHGVCESCGIVVQPFELQHSNCTQCKNPSSQKTISIYTFNLKKYLPGIQSELLSLPISYQQKEIIDRVSALKNLKVLLTYPDKNSQGIHLPETDQVIHVWFEMAAHYEQFSLSQKFWVHCFGFDNSFYYLLFIPALLRAINPQAKLPDSIITNHFLQLEGYKFSTSRNHAIWANEFIGNVDHLRLYLSLNRPSKHPENFSMKDFQSFSSSLENQMQKLIHRAHLLVEQPKSNLDSKKLLDCNRVIRNMEYYLSPKIIDLRRASRELIFFIDFAIQSEGSGYSEKLILHTLGMIMLPFMPNEARLLLTSLELTSHEWVRDWSSLYPINMHL